MSLSMYSGHAQYYHNRTDQTTVFVSNNTRSFNYGSFIKESSKLRSMLTYIHVHENFMICLENISLFRWTYTVNI